MNVYESTLLAEIRERRRIEGWYRVNGWAEWTDLRRENRAALSALLKVARLARREEARRARAFEDLYWNSSSAALLAERAAHDSHEAPEKGCDLCSREMDASYRAVVGYAR